MAGRFCARRKWRTLVRVTRFMGVAAITTAVTCGFPADAAAQESVRPFRGLFGGSNPNGAARELTLTLSASEAFDDDLTGSRGGQPNPTKQRGRVSGLHSSGAAAIDFRRSSERFTLTANAQTAAQYFPELDDLFGLSHHGAVALTANLGRLQFGVSQGLASSPFYSLSVRPVPVEFVTQESPVLDFAVSSRESIVFDTRTNASYQLTARTSVGGTFSFRKADFAAGDTDLTQRSGSIRISRTFTRYLGLSLGYSVQQARYAGLGGRQHETRAINIGTNYNRPLSRTRRTMLSIRTGTASADERGRTTYRFVGGAGLSRQMGRTWTATAEYERGVRYIEGLVEPLFSDTVSARFQGMLNRRTDIAADLGYSSGVVGLSAAAPGFTTYSWTIHARFAISRLAAATTEILYYRHEFERLDAALSLPRQFDRRGARVGLTLWLPFLR